MLAKTILEVPFNVMNKYINPFVRVLREKCKICAVICVDHPVYSSAPINNGTELFS